VSGMNAQDVLTSTVNKSSDLAQPLFIRNSTKFFPPRCLFKVEVLIAAIGRPS